MNHKEWIKNQFRAVRGRALYRDVIIHTSFVETATKQLGRVRDFQCSVKILRAGHPEHETETEQLEKLRKMRNRMVHDLLRDEQLTNTEVIKVIRAMKKLLREIYHKNDGLINRYFNEKHKIDTKNFS